MRVLHLTDTHLGHRRPLIGAPRGWRRADDHHEAMLRALAPALREEVDLVVHSGDVFHRSRPPRADVLRCLEALEAVARRVPVLVISGNHDRRGLQRHLARPVPGLTVVDRPLRVGVGGLEIGLIPYQRTSEAWAAAARALGTVDWIVCHQAFDGVRIPRPGGRSFHFHLGQRDTVGAPHLPAVRAVACGHIHPRQVVTVRDIPVVHPGSTERTAFSERDQIKGYALWSFESEARWRFVDLPGRPMRVVDTAGDLDAIRPGDQILVRAEPLRAPALSRGGWVVPHHGPRAEAPLSLQLGLFR